MRGAQNRVRSLLSPLASLLRLLPSPKSGWGFLGYLIVLYKPVSAALTELGNVDLVAENADWIESTLATGWGTALLMALGFALLLYAGYKQQPKQQTRAGPQSEATTPQPAPSEADSRQAQETALSAEGEIALVQPPAIRTTPSEVLSGPCILNQDVSIEDLMRDGFVRDGKIESVEFRNCTIRGPGVVTLEAPPPTEPVRGSSATPMMWEAGTCRIEGSPESVLWEVPSGGAMAKGVIYLRGCAFRQVTFRNIAIAGSPNGLESWKHNCTFSEGSANSRPSLSEVQAENERLKEEAEQLTAQRNGQIRVRCRKLADGLDRLSEGWKRDDPKNREALREYNDRFKAEAVSVINDLKTFDLWKPKVDDPKRLESPENRKDVQDLAGYLRWVANAFPT